MKAAKPAAAKTAAKRRSLVVDNNIDFESIYSFEMQVVSGMVKRIYLHLEELVILLMVVLFTLMAILSMPMYPEQHLKLILQLQVQVVQLQLAQATVF